MKKRGSASVDRKVRAAESRTAPIGGGGGKGHRRKPE